MYTDTAAIDARVDSIDRFLTAHPERVRLYAQLPGQKKLIAVKDSTAWPERVETSYNIGFDESGRPVVHRAMPTSESGDWFEMESHYFAPDGHTMLQEFSMSSFGSHCANVLREIRRTYLASDGKVLRQSWRFIDDDGKPIKNVDSCQRRGEVAPDPKRNVGELPFPTKPVK